MQTIGVILRSALRNHIPSTNSQFKKLIFKISARQLVTWCQNFSVKMTTSTVELYIYDLSRGMACVLSPLLIGKRIEGVWHTSIVVYGKEYFFGSRGIESCRPGGTMIGDPLQVLKLGDTQIPKELFKEYLMELSNSSWSPSSYDLLTHNCNHFSEELAQFLCGESIPKYILDLPNEVLNSSLGPSLALLAGQMERSARPLDDDESSDRPEGNNPNS